MSTIGHAIDAVGAQRGRRDRDVVEQAEPHRPVGLGVMARRPDQRQRRLAGLERVTRRVDRRAGRQQRDLVRLRARERIGIEHHGAPGGRRQTRRDRCGV